MIKLSISDIISKIQNEECFHAVADDNSLAIKIDTYVPYACAAIHDGHQFRKELWQNCLHTDYDRWYEEDPETKHMVQSHPIVISGSDSRFEYDLNRAPEEAVFETAWGKQLWKSPLANDQKERSLNKHQGFYNVVEALVSKLEQKFETVVVYDMHSYNLKRWDRVVPTWNLGTSNVDNNRFGADIESWRNMLENFKLPNNIKSIAAINNTLYGNGYFLKFITKTFSNTLVLATEISKIYCDEYSGVIFPEVVHAVESQLKTNLKEHAMQFVNRHSQK